MRKVWEKEAHICSLVWGLGEKGWHSHTLKNLKKTGSSMFFVESILVTPNRFRPANMMDGKVGFSLMLLFPFIHYVGLYFLLLCSGMWPNRAHGLILCLLPLLLL